MSNGISKTDLNLIPAGYKQTEVGVIPEDWEVTTFGNVMSIRHGKNQQQIESQNGLYPILATGGQIGWGNSYLWNKPSILIGRKGTINKPRYCDTPFWTVDTLFYSEISHQVDAKFTYYKFCMIDWMKYNEASGVPSLNASTIESVLAAYPTKKEQTAIANALSDVDSLISELEKLIAKKQAIKTSTMQQLLTGRTRLPQFALREDGSKKGTKQSELGEIPEDWNLVSLQNMATPNGLVRGPFGGAIKKEHFTKTGYKVYEQRNAIYETINIGNYYIDQKKFDELKRFSISHNDLIVSCSGKIGRIYQIPNKYPKGVINQALLKITLNQSIDSKYFYHYFKWDEFQKRIIDGTQGGAMKNLVGMAEFKQSLMPLPTIKEEQTAIATILSNMDEEIQALEQRLSKTLQIKQGMMQELLTGKTRLVQPSPTDICHVD